MGQTTYDFNEEKLTTIDNVNGEDIIKMMDFIKIMFMEAIHDL